MKGKREAAATMRSVFAEEILMDILKRLPVKPLIRFKCVSKSFCALISSPYFIKMHLKHNREKNNMGIVFYNCQKTQGTYEYDSLSLLSSLWLSPPSSTLNEFDRVINQMDESFVYPDYLVGSLCSCNGMICISFVKTDFGFGENLVGDIAKEELFFIWNPATKEYKKIPSSGILSINLGLFGFGYDAETDDYKLVRVADIDNGENWSEVEIYTLRFNSWKSIPNIPYRPSKCGKQPPGVLVNGALHWIANNVWFFKVIVRFDIDDESFMEAPLPNVFMRHQEVPTAEEDDEFDASVGVVAGRLCLLTHVFHVQVDLWAMDEYGVSESWTKCFSINTTSVTSNSSLRLIRSFNSYGILLQGDGCLIIYDPYTKRDRKVSITYNGENKCRELERLIAAESYVPSLVSQSYYKFS